MNFSLISAVNHDTKLPFTSYEIGTIVGAKLSNLTSTTDETSETH